MDTINKTDTFDFTDVTDEQIQTVIKYKERQIENLQAQITVLESDLTYYRSALRRRELAAFWQANEGLRLEVGDRLLALCPSRYSKDEDIEFKVADIDYDLLVRSQDAITITNAYVHRISISLDIARRMREAYLQAHGEAQP